MSAAQAAETDLAALSSQLQANNIGTQPVTAQELTAALDAIQTQGTSGVSSLLESLGFTDAEIQTMEQEVEAETIPSSLLSETADFALNNLASNFGSVTPTPVLSGGDNSVNYTPQGAAVAVDAGLAASDASSATLAGATVAISAGFFAGDTLNFANQNGIAGSYNATTGVLTLTGSASLANYQAALESIAFSSTSGNPSNSGADPSRTVSWTVTDGTLSSNTVASTIVISAPPPPPPPPPHVPPTVQAVSSVSVAENQSTAGSSLVASINNPSGDSIRQYIFLDEGGGTGYFTFNDVPQPDGQWIYPNDSSTIQGSTSVNYVGGASPGTDTLELGIYDSTTNTYSYSSVITATTTPPPPPPPPPTTAFAIFDVTTGVQSLSDGTPYTGPVAGLVDQFIYTGADNLDVAAGVPNTFIHTGSGEDAIDVMHVGGTNVLDGGTGSNFQVGGTGPSSFDTFFLDDRGPSSDIWSTVANFHTGDAATIFGITPNGFNTAWVDGQGAAGYMGLTLHVTAPGVPTASLTLSGYTSADLTNGRLTTSYGTENDGTPYLYVHGN